MDDDNSEDNYRLRATIIAPTPIPVAKARSYGVHALKISVEESMLIAAISLRFFLIILHSFYFIV